MMKGPDGNMIGWYKNELQNLHIGALLDPEVTESPNNRDLAVTFSPFLVGGHNLYVAPGKAKAGNTWRDTCGGYQMLLHGLDSRCPVWCDPDDKEAMEELAAMVKLHGIRPEAMFEVSSFKLVFNAETGKYEKVDVKRVGHYGARRYLKEVTSGAEKVLRGEVDVDSLAHASTKITEAEKKRAEAEDEATKLKALLESQKAELDAGRQAQAELAAIKQKAASKAAEEHGKKPPKG